jgi:hypothetical protein
LSILEGKVAKELEGVIPPGAAERLVDHPAEQGPVSGVTPQSKPALGLRVDPGPIEGPGFGGQGRDPPLALASGVDREPRVLLGGRVWVRRDVDDLVAELLEHALVDLDRLGIIAGLGVVVGAPEVGVGLVARVEVDFCARPGDLHSVLELPERRAGRTGPGDHDEDGKPARDRPRPAHPAAADISHDLILHAKSGGCRRPVSQGREELGVRNHPGIELHPTEARPVRFTGRAIEVDGPPS